MQNRNSLTVLLSTIVGVLLAAIMGLVACGGPATSAEEDPPEAGSTASDGPGWHLPTIGWQPPTKPTSKPTKTRKPSTSPTSSKPSTDNGPPKPPPSGTKPPKPVPPRMGMAPVPDDMEYRLSPDGLTSTTTFSGLKAESGEESVVTTRMWSFPTTGDSSNAVIDFQVSGYAFIEGPATAKVTVTLCGRAARWVFPSPRDDDFLEEYRVKLGGAKECRVLVSVESRPEKGGGVAVINVLAVDARLD
jgi:hypothetical protein